MKNRKISTYLIEYGVNQTVKDSTENTAEVRQRIVSKDDILFYKSRREEGEPLSIEAFALTNLLMNVLVLSVGARCIGHVRWKRVICAAVLGTLYASTVYACPGQTWLAGAPARIAALLCMALVVFGDRPLRMSLIGGAYLAGSVIFAGGVLLLLSRWFDAGSPTLTVVGCAVIAVSVLIGDSLCADGISSCCIDLRIGTRMGNVCVRALVDTGNRLREPISGLPVIIVERESLKGILDQSCLMSDGKRRLLPGFRRVSYSVLGGSGEMICFRPESVMARYGKEWRETPEVWIGIYQGRLPASAEALSPPLSGHKHVFYGG